MSHNLAVAYAMKKKKMGQDPVDESPERDGNGMPGEDIVDKVMRKRYSEGGKVANETETVADFEPNEFDDLALRDDLHSTYGEDDNSGDALGNKSEDERREDIVSRVMRQRSMKQRNPSPA